MKKLTPRIAGWLSLIYCVFGIATAIGSARARTGADAFYRSALGFVFGFASAWYLQWAHYNEERRRGR